MGIRKTTLCLLLHRHTHELLAPCMPAPETSAATNSPYDAQMELPFPDDNGAPPSGSQGLRALLLTGTGTRTRWGGTNSRGGYIFALNCVSELLDAIKAADHKQEGERPWL
jgi:hypothetical protein